MSDGDRDTPDATPGPAGASRDAANQWLTRSHRPSPGAAPWERKPVTDGGADAVGPAGNHTDGVTVADLIAKLSGDTAVPPSLRRQSDPERDELVDIDADDEHDTEVMSVVPATSNSDLPNLTLVRRPARVPAA